MTDVNNSRILLRKSCYLLATQSTHLQDLWLFVILATSHKFLTLLSLDYFTEPEC